MLGNPVVPHRDRAVSPAEPHLVFRAIRVGVKLLDNDDDAGKAMLELLEKR